eukprot:269834-Chlamydomonas_euryale.AAC.1
MSTHVTLRTGGKRVSASKRCIARCTRCMRMHAVHEVHEVHAKARACARQAELRTPGEVSKRTSRCRIEGRRCTASQQASTDHNAFVCVRVHRWVHAYSVSLPFPSNRARPCTAFGTACTS